MQQQLKPPFPYFGNKTKAAPIVWEFFGDPTNYVEPFCGSAAMLLARPNVGAVETINDACGYVANFWRAVKADPEAVAYYADWPVNENDLHARHAWLVGQNLRGMLEGNPDIYHAKAAGYWAWGACCWIGDDWCSGRGPWAVVDGQLQRTGEGVVSRKLPHLDKSHRGLAKPCNVLEWLTALSARLRGVRVACGDWKRVLGYTPTLKVGATAVFLDPPYSSGNMAYGQSVDLPEVVEWCRANADTMRICLCGYEGDYDLPGWRCVAWKAASGYGVQKRDGYTRRQERLWLNA